MMVKFEDLCVADVMTPLQDIDAIDFASLRRANVEQVIAAMVKTGRAHMLVIESAGDTSAAEDNSATAAQRKNRMLTTSLFDGR